MRDIAVVEVDEIESFFDSFWLSKEFKELNKNHNFFNKFKEKLKEAPIFFFDNEHENGRYHLSSHFRFIANRTYENPIIRDLYYFHELLHCAEFEADPDSSFEKWKSKLDNNEMYASIVSEVLIYFMQPSLVGKTFENLWAKRFLDKFESYPKKDKNGFFITDEYGYYDVMSFANIFAWPKSVQYIFNERIRLRGIDNVDLVNDVSEKAIVTYNLPRNKWLDNWRPHYKKIDTLLKNLNDEKISSKEFQMIVENNVDKYGRAFYPRNI